jgi:hypothetical protein
MNFHWISQSAPCPVVEFHDIRTEKFKADTYLTLIEKRLQPAFMASGGQVLGQFRVDDHPDRLIVVRGFAGMTARRQALTAFHAGPDWAAQRAEAAALLREQRVSLTRSIVPADGIKPIRPEERLTAVISEVRFSEQIGNYHLWLRLLLRKAGLDPVAAFATLEAVNDVPAVPVVKNRAQHIALLRSGGRAPELPPELRAMVRYAPEILVLEPAFALVW